MNAKIEKFEDEQLKSFIVQKDDETLIVSQHIPADFNCANNQARNKLKQSVEIQPYYIQ